MSYHEPSRTTELLALLRNREMRVTHLEQELAEARAAADDAERRMATLTRERNTLTCTNGSWRRWFYDARARAKQVKKEFASYKKRNDACLRALRREAAALRKRIEQLEARLSDESELQRRLSEQARLIEQLKAELGRTVHRLYGRKSEKGEPGAGGANEAPGAGSAGESEAPAAAADKPAPGKRGWRPGRPGHGRKRLSGELPREEVIHDFAEPEATCPCCGKPYRLLKSGGECSEELVVRTPEVVVREHVRRKYVRTCECPGTPRFKTAPAPPKLIPKGLLAGETLAYLLTLKYHDGIPLNRILRQLARSGAELDAGTVTGAFAHVEGLLAPVHEACRLKVHESRYWHMDETGYLVFQLYEDKTSPKCWLWVCVGEDASYFHLDPSRSGDVAIAILPAEAVGYLMVDRYAGYQKGTMPKGVVLLFCWAHVRRDFFEAGKIYGLKEWAKWYLRAIKRLYALHEEVTSAPSDSALQRAAMVKRRKHLHKIRKRAEEDRARENLAPIARKAVVSLLNHWEGLIAFAEKSWLPIDNNEAERTLRGPVVGRKNFYGCGAHWSADLASAMWSIGASCVQQGRDPYAYLRSYFDACARNGGCPPDNLAGLLPWDFDAEARAGP